MTANTTGIPSLDPGKTPISGAQVDRAVLIDRQIAATRLILSQCFSFDLAALHAGPGWRLKEICPSTVLQWLSPAVARKLQCSARRFHTREAKSL